MLKRSLVLFSVTASLIAMASDVPALQKVLRKPFPKVAEPVNPAGTGTGGTGGASDDEVIRIDTGLRNDSVRMLDRSGKPFPKSFTVDDLIITDNGDKIFNSGNSKPIAFFERGNVPILYGIVMDNSKSILPMLKSVMKAGEVFVAQSKPEDWLFLQRFAGPGNQETMRRPIAQVGSDKNAAIQEYYDAWYTQGGGSAINDAIRDSLGEIKSGKQQLTKAKKMPESGVLQNIILITDGEDRREGAEEGSGSDTTMQALREMLAESDTQIYVLSYAECLKSSENPKRYENAQKYLQEIIDATGGELFSIKNPLCTAADERNAAKKAAADQELNLIAQTINTTMREQYMLGYYPKNTDADGSTHTIKIELKPEVLAKLGATRPIVAGYQTKYVAGDAKTFKEQKDREAKQAEEAKERAAEKARASKQYDADMANYRQIQRLVKAQASAWTKIGAIDVPSEISAQEIESAASQIKSGNSEQDAVVRAAAAWTAAYNELVQAAKNQVSAAEAKQQAAEEAKRKQQEAADEAARKKQQAIDDAKAKQADDARRAAQAKAGEFNTKLEAGRKAYAASNFAEAFKAFAAASDIDVDSTEAATGATFSAISVRPQVKATIATYANRAEAAINKRLATPASLTPEGLKGLQSDLSTVYWAQGVGLSATNPTLAVAKVLKTLAIPGRWDNDPSALELLQSILYTAGYKNPKNTVAKTKLWANALIGIWERLVVAYDKLAVSKPARAAEFQKISGEYVEQLKQFIPFASGKSAEDLVLSSEDVQDRAKATAAKPLPTAAEFPKF